MEEIMTTEDLDTGRKKAVGMSLLALGALAASGEGYRRRRQADSSGEWARKGLVLVLVFGALAALLAMGARHRRARAAEVASTDDALVGQEDGAEPISRSRITATGT